MSMTKTKSSESKVSNYRKPGVIPRTEYIQRSKEFAVRGESLAHSKLIALDVATIRSAVKQRNNLRKYLKDNLSNEALSKQFGVSVTTIERVTTMQTWSHI